MEYNLHLTAGVPSRQGTRGSYLLLLSTGAAASVDVKLYHGHELLEHLSAAERGAKFRVPKQFDKVEITAGVDADVAVVISDGAVDIDLFAGANVNATIAGPHTGTVADPINVSAVTVADAPATGVTAYAPVAVGAAGAVIKAANANCRAFIVTNFGPDPFALGAAGITWAARGAIVLDAGDTLTIDRGGNLAWSGVTDAGLGASVGVTELLQ